MKFFITGKAGTDVFKAESKEALIQRMQEAGVNPSDFVIQTPEEYQQERIKEAKKDRFSILDYFFMKKNVYYWYAEVFGKVYKAQCACVEKNAGNFAVLDRGTNFSADSPICYTRAKYFRWSRNKVVQISNSVSHGLYCWYLFVLALCYSFYTNLYNLQKEIAFLQIKEAA